MGNAWRVGLSGAVGSSGLGRSGLAFGLLAAGLAGLTASAQAAGPRLAPHEAVYDLSLSRAESGGVVGAKGLMNYKLENTCSGWTMESRTVLNLFYAEGGRMETEWEFVAYEGKTGGDYSFYIRNSRNGQTDEVLEGGAQMDGGSAKGTARFKRPDENAVALPEGTLFPSAHTLAIIRAAQAGEHFVTKTVFDGASAAGAGLVTAFIGKELGADTVPESADPLLKTPSWPMTIAFFHPDGEKKGEDDASIPSYEVKVRYHDNGVAQEMEQNFGFFSLNSHLKALKALPEPEC
ncbi:MAG: cell envelope integrity EipB family protein [Rhodospirillum sp.]|nr:cell envelope integrity EipB family protein [Rhodospirillum sp.]MCF8492122.1 cell envelope integrity EipB family protein [Rhodospirillum sp.]MCF8502695.1 cell envelope integrity EipB family protein [Rhodospirillum sp.]